MVGEICGTALDPRATFHHQRNVSQHSFEIEGQGIEKKLDQPLAPDASATLQVDLAPGEYTVYCPVADYYDRGMKRQIRVIPGADGPPSGIGPGGSPEVSPTTTPDASPSP